jgi:hypothetical protein
VGPIARPGHFQRPFTTFPDAAAYTCSTGRTTTTCSTGYDSATCSSGHDSATCSSGRNSATCSSGRDSATCSSGTATCSSGSTTRPSSTGRTPAKLENQTSGHSRFRPRATGPHASRASSPHRAAAEPAVCQARPPRLPGRTGFARDCHPRRRSGNDNTTTNPLLRGNNPQRRTPSGRPSTLIRAVRHRA